MFSFRSSLSIMLLALSGCTDVARVESGTLRLVGARETNEQLMQAWAGPTVRLLIGRGTAQLETETGDTIDLQPTAWPRADWVRGCHTLRGSIPQEVWDLACEPQPIVEGLALTCPAALIADCGDRISLMLRDPPERGGDSSGCGSSGRCWQFQPID
jgi:hypothetical protein